MKRKLKMTLAIILATSSLIACEQDTVDTTQIVTQEAVAQSYPGLPNDGSAIESIEEDVVDTVDIEETEVIESISDLPEEIQGKTPEEIAQMIADGTFVPSAEPQISTEDEPALVTNISVFVPEGEEEEEVIIFDNYETTQTNPETPVVQLDPTGVTPMPTIVNPTIDTSTLDAVFVPTTVDPPQVITAPEYPISNVDYNLTLIAGENTVIENVSVSVQMKQPLQEGVVPASNGWYVPGEIVTNLVNANATTTFSVEDWRTTFRHGYETIITINYGKPFSISTDLIERIPSVNGVVEVYVSQLFIDDSEGSADINITLTDETGIW